MVIRGLPILLISLTLSVVLAIVLSVAFPQFLLPIVILVAMLFLGFNMLVSGPFSQ